MKFFKKIIAGAIGLAFGAFAATQVVYWLNLDNKLFFFIVYPFLQKRYDKAEHDRRF